MTGMFTCPHTRPFTRKIRFSDCHSLFTITFTSVSYGQQKCVTALGICHFIYCVSQLVFSSIKSTKREVKIVGIGKSKCTNKLQESSTQKALLCNCVKRATGLARNFQRVFSHWNKRYPTAGPMASDAPWNVFVPLQSMSVFDGILSECAPLCRRL